jgi:NAD-dependent SIR2 family protein deacetylase
MAGSRNVIDLHGVLQRIRCLECGATTLRREFQGRLARLNPGWQASAGDCSGWRRTPRHPRFPGVFGAGL